MNQYNLGILGCGSIFNRHLEAVRFNENNFKIIGIFDPNINLINQWADLDCIKYNSEDELYQDDKINCVVILTPSGLHTAQIQKAINYGRNVIVEKPAGFNSKELYQLEALAKQKGVRIFTILQVRLNPTIQALHKLVKDGYLGKIRGVSLVQRWQRPLSYFDGWRGNYDLCGGVLREFSIHYIDAMLYSLNSVIPKVHSSIFKNVKLYNNQIYDSINVLLDFTDFSGSIEVNIGAEPSNLECSLSIMSDNGFIKLGGKSLDVVVESKFLSYGTYKYFENLCILASNNLHVKVASVGASPYHPELYYNIINNPDLFTLDKTIPVIQLIENIYSTNL